MNGAPKSMMLVSIVSKDPSILVAGAAQISNSARDQQLRNPASAMDSLFLKKDNLMIYESQVLEVMPYQQINLTYGELDCQFDIEMKLDMDTSRVVSFYVLC